MGNGRKVVCVLCERSEETKITGPLSTKDSTTAHQNCLLYSSGICCQSSPQFDDLFGFSVEDVKDEVKRGKKLYCNGCKLKGATAGCEVRRCKKSYHYPCAVQQGAVNEEDDAEGRYVLYCSKHSEQREGTIDSPASSTRGPETNKTPNEAASYKVVCLDCEHKEENIRLESLNTAIVMSYCDKHKPSRRRDRLNSADAVAGPSSCNSDSNSSNSLKGLSSKRRLTSNGKQEGTPSKRKSPGWKKRIQDESSDEDKPDADMAPLESDIEEGVNSNPGHQFSLETVTKFIRNDAESPAASNSGNHLVGQSRGGDEDEDETRIDSDAESESLLLPVMVCMELETSGTSLDSIHCPDLHTARPSGPQRGSTAPSKPLRDTSLPPRTNLVVSPAPPENSHVPPSSSRSSSTPRRRSSPPTPVSLPPVPESSLDAANFWKGCNEAGCTQDIFTDFIAEMSNISNRIKSDRASQEDYNLALRVMEASGKLAELVAKQQDELNKRRTELERAAAAMKKVVSSLRK